MNDPYLNCVVFEKLILDRDAKSLFEDFSRLDGKDKARQAPQQHLKTTLMWRVVSEKKQAHQGKWVRSNIW